MQNTGQCVSVVGRELRVQLVTRCQRLARGSKVRNIRVRLASKYGIAFHPAFLRQFNLGVPVSAFYQTNRNAPSHVTRKLREKTHSVAATTHVGLNRQTEAIPVIERRITIDGFENIKPHFQTVGFF